MSAPSAPVKAVRLTKQPTKVAEKPVAGKKHHDPKRTTTFAEIRKAMVERVYLKKKVARVSYETAWPSSVGRATKRSLSIGADGIGGSRFSIKDHRDGGA